MYRGIAYLTMAALLVLAGNALGQPGVGGWWSETIGISTPGNATITAGTYTVTGNGADIWGTEDGFHYLYKQLVGNGSITARVVNNGTGANAWAKGGVMIRDDNTSGCRHAMQVLTGGDGGGSAFQWRPTPDAASSNAAAASPAVAPPYWVRIERVGNAFSGYTSADGKTWVQQGTTQTLALQDPVLIGLCVSSHVSGTLRTYTFDNVGYTGNVTDRPPQVKATNPSPADGATGVTLPLFQWSAGETAVLHRVYFGATPELTEADLVIPQQSSLTYFHGPGMTPGVTYYWRVDEIDAAMAVHTGDVWSATAATVTAYNPIPPDGSKYQDIEVDLAWTAGVGGIYHEVYFGTDKDAVANGAASAFKGKQLGVTFELDTLAMQTTYYWRVDEIDMADNKKVGAVWSFTTTIPGLGAAKRELWNDIAGGAISNLTSDARFPDSPDAIDEMPNFESPAGIGDTYGGRLSAWLHVPATGDYTFWIASDDNGELRLGPDQENTQLVARVPGWSNAREWDKFPHQKSQPIHLEAGRYYLEALWKEGTGGDNCSVAWQGPGIPQRTLISGNYLMRFEPYWAYGQSPIHGAVDVPHVPELRWIAGARARQHDVYFGEDAAAVAAATPASAGIYQGQQALEQTTFSPGELAWDQTYYWRVDELNAAEVGSPWTGSVWSFTTADFLVIDDFESYNDEENKGTRIYETWLDGWSVSPRNGATVGNWDPPFAEQTIVHGGSQSMPFDYNNLAAPFYSEAYRQFTAAQDWTLNGVTDLVLFVRGYPAVEAVAVTETAGRMTVTGSGVDIWGTSDQFTFAYKTLTGDGSIVACVDSNGVGSNRWAKGGVMIRDSLDGGSTFANMVLTGGDGNGAAFQWRAVANANAAWDGAGPTTRVAPPYWVKIERVGNSLTGYLSPDGQTWSQQGTTQTIAMSAPVYIGLCVTSHAPTEQRTYEFSGVKTTGNVSGDWQGAIIMVQVVNSQQPLYVTVEDSTGKKATVTHPDPAAVNVTAWTEWRIPLGDLAGVNATRVRRLYLGVGDKSTVGSGRIFIDDIRVARPEGTPNAD